MEHKLCSVTEIEELLKQIEGLTEDVSDKEYEKRIRNLAKVANIEKIARLAQTAYMAMIFLPPLIGFRQTIESKTKNKMHSPEFDKDLELFCKETDILNGISIKSDSILDDSQNTDGKVH